MTATLILIIVTAVAGIAGAGFLDRRRQRLVAAASRRTSDDMFAYTMYDDPC
jgi:hypothetical protein